MTLLPLPGRSYDRKKCRHKSSSFSQTSCVNSIILAQNAEMIEKKALLCMRDNNACADFALVRRGAGEAAGAPVMHAGACRTAFDLCRRPRYARGTFKPRFIPRHRHRHLPLPRRVHLPNIRSIPCTRRTPCTPYRCLLCEHSIRRKHR